MFLLLHIILLSYFTRNIYTVAEKYPRSEKNGQGMYGLMNIAKVYLISCLHNKRETGMLLIDLVISRTTSVS